MKSIKKKQVFQFALCFAALLLLPAISHAAGSGMPWEDPLQRVLDSVSGPVARVLGTLAIIGFGFGFAFSEHGGAMRKALGIVFGLAIAFTAGSFGLNLFGFAGGCAF